MGAMTITMSVSMDPEEFSKEFRQTIKNSPAAEGLTELRLLQDVEVADQLSLELRWQDVSIARKNFEAVKALLTSRGRMLSEPRIKSSVGQP
jgi:quinol monooxygenase YgiN